MATNLDNLKAALGSDLADKYKDMLDSDPAIKAAYEEAADVPPLPSQDEINQEEAAVKVLYTAAELGLQVLKLDQLVITTELKEKAVKALMRFFDWFDWADDSEGGE